MLGNATVACALPAKDLERAKLFYKEKLDMSPTSEDLGGVTYECADGTAFFVYISMGQSRADFTQIGFAVEDLEKEVRELTEKGVVFEQYDYPELKTDENGIVNMDGEKAAWFKDSEGNLLSINQRTTS